MKDAKQSGVAVVTALLLTTLAITIVASLFWQQQVQVRSIENQRFQLQKKWVLRGALDWAGLILREDARTGTVDHLGEPWAINLGETRLDQYVENGKTETEDSDASLSGQISDAQAKFNLTNLSQNGVINEHQVEVFAKLLSNLRMDASLAPNLATQVAVTQEKQIKSSNPLDPNLKSTPVGPNPSPNSSTTSTGTVPLATNTTNPEGDLTVGLSITSGSEVQSLRFSQVDDLLAVPGFNIDMVLKLKNFVTVLPIFTKVNVNTTTAEVLSAYLENVSMTDAALMIASRDRAFFLNFDKFKLNFPDKVNDKSANDLECQTSYFIINGKVKLNRSALEVNALIKRDSANQKTEVLWIKEN
jgi:general secretion pathway protein K